MSESGSIFTSMDHYNRTILALTLAGLALAMKQAFPQSGVADVAMVILWASAVIVLLWPQVRALITKHALPYFKRFAAPVAATAMPVGVQLDPIVQHATMVVHGGKLCLEIQDLSGEKRGSIFHTTGSGTTTTVLISIFNRDYHDTVEDVAVTAVNYCWAENRHLMPFPLEIPLCPAHGRTTVNPQDRIPFRLGVMEDNHINPNIKRHFWIGEADAGERLEMGAYLITVSYSGKNHSRSVKKIPITLDATGLTVGDPE